MASITKSRALLIGVVGVEAIGVVTGISNAFYTTFESNWPNTPLEYVPALPMVALAATEGLRIPLTTAFYRKHVSARVLAIFLAAGCTYTATENFAVGFTRIFNMRVTPVLETDRELAKAETMLANAKTGSERKSNAKTGSLSDLAEQIKQLGTNIADLDAKAIAEDTRHKEENAAITARCRLTRAGDGCFTAASAAESQFFQKKKDSIEDERREKAKKQSELQLKQQQLSDAKQTSSDEFDAAARVAEENVSALREKKRKLTETDTLYSFAGSFFRTTEMSQAEFATARLWFSTVSGIIVAMASMLGAFVYYAPDRGQDDLSFAKRQLAKLARARRAYLVRLRKKAVRIVPGPTVFRDRVVFRDRESELTAILRALFGRSAPTPTFDGKPVEYVGDHPQPANDKFDSNVVPISKEKAQ